MPLTLDNLHDVISYHAPDDEGIARIERIREASENLIRVIIQNAPGCADASAAIRHAREAMMTANSAIALKGLV